MSYFNKCNTFEELMESRQELLEDINKEYEKRKEEIRSKRNVTRRVHYVDISSVRFKRDDITLLPIKRGEVPANEIIFSVDGFSI